MDLKGVLEGILFVVGDEGITLNKICEILNFVYFFWGGSKKWNSIWV